MATPDAQMPSTATRVLDVAQKLAQTRGFNGFSYADISVELGIKKASLHYHFASKADLGRALIERYARGFAEALSALEGDVPTQLLAYVQLYEAVLVQDRMCLCGMLAAEYSTLAPPMQDALRAFFDMNDDWLTSLLERGRVRGEIAFEGTSVDAARSLTASLEGAMLIARSYGDTSRFSE